MTEDGISGTNPTPLKSAAFIQRREDLLNRLLVNVKDCQNKFGERKELATGQNEVVISLCDCLEEVLSYGLKQNHQTVTVASLLQNVQEIVSGNIGGLSNDSTFWDFCQKHLTAHERERFENLKNVSTNIGKGRAFIRAALNENSLQRYIIKWLNADDIDQFYTHWSILTDPGATNILSSLSAGLNTILFAITIDTKDLDNTTEASAVRREEPIIFAPAPVPIITQKKKRTSAVERPICTLGEKLDDNSICPLYVNVSKVNQEKSDKEKTALEYQHLDRCPSHYSKTDYNKTELEFLKNHLPNFSAYNNHESIEEEEEEEREDETISVYDQDAIFRTEDEKSETSSQYSKSSSAFSQEKSFNKSDTSELEAKLREMTDRCSLLETRVAQLSLENRQLIRRLTQSFNDSGIDPSSSSTSNFLITIPQVKLLKSSHSHSKYYAYEIHITMRHNLEHWMVTRRYREFRELHKSLKTMHPTSSMLATLEIPPKKRFGNMNPHFVDDRRQQLQFYLISVIEMLPHVEGCKTKSELISKFPFFQQR